MIYFCCYDIHSDKVRRKVIRVLEEYGDRIQKSIFVLHVPTKAIDHILAKIDSFLPEDDDLLIIGLEKHNPVFIRGKGQIDGDEAVCVL